MKLNSLATSSLVVLSLLSAAGAYAQSAVRATIPFAFKAGKTEVPAGTYIMQRDSETNMVAIRNLQTQAVVFAMSTAQGPSSELSKAVFHQANGQYTLTQVYGSEGASAWSFAPKPKGRHEVETASSAATAGQTIEIALK